MAIKISNDQYLMFGKRFGRENDRRQSKRETNPEICHCWSVIVRQNFNYLICLTCNFVYLLHKYGHTRQMWFKISPKFIVRVPIDHRPSLTQTVVWCKASESHPFNEWWDLSVTVKPNQFEPWIIYCLKQTLLSTSLPPRLRNFVTWDNRQNGRVFFLLSLFLMCFLF